MPTLAELAALVEGELVGNPGLVITGVSEIQHGRPGTITFLSNPRYRKYVAGTRAAALLCRERSLLAGRDGVVVGNPQLAFTRILELFAPPALPPAGIHPSALVDSQATIGPEVSIGAYAVVESQAVIEARAVLGPHVLVGAGAVIGRETTLQGHVTIYPHCRIGARCRIHSGTVIGADGFGYVTAAGVHHKVPQIGIAVIEDEVEIGANCTIDRATLGETVIGAGSKLDNLVHVGHNVKLGRGCLLAGEVGIAGSVTVGDGCIFAGQAGVAPHLEIGAQAVFAAKSGVTKSLPGGKVYAGMPAREIRTQHRREAVLTEVASLKKRMVNLEAKVGRLSPGNS